MGLLEQVFNTPTPRPLMKVHGVPVYTFHDAQGINKKMLVEEQYGGKEIELGDREVTNNGLGYKKSRVKVAAVNPELYTKNRYRRVKEGNKVYYEVVTDYRAIKEQSKGNIYTNSITVYRLAKQGNGMTVVGVKTVDDNEFIAEFKGALNENAMMLVLSAIQRHGSTEPDKDGLDWK